MADTEPLRVSFSKPKILKLLMHSSIFLILGVSLLALWYGVLMDQNNPFALKGVVLQVCSWLCILFFCFIGYFLVSEYNSAEPGLIIDDNGITDHTSELSAGQIPWSNIETVVCVSAGIRSYCSIFLKDPSEFMDKENFLVKLFKRMNVKSTGPQVRMLTNKLDIEHADLVAAIKQACGERGIEVMTE